MYPRWTCSYRYNAAAQCVRVHAECAKWLRRHQEGCRLCPTYLIKQDVQVAFEEGPVVRLLNWNLFEMF